MSKRTTEAMAITTRHSTQGSSSKLCGGRAAQITATAANPVVPQPITFKKMGGKWMEILKELAPALTRVGFLYNPTTAPGGGSYFLKRFEAAAPSFKVQPIAAPVENAADIERTLASLGADGNGGLVVDSDIFTSHSRADIIAAAARHRVPTIYPLVLFVADGGLIAYGTDPNDLFRRAASYIDRVLRGEKPADLPVQAPVKYQLVVNLNAAKAIGLTIPEAFLLRADEVIE